MPLFCILSWLVQCHRSTQLYLGCLCPGNSGGIYHDASNWLHGASPFICHMESIHLLTQILFGLRSKVYIFFSRLEGFGFFKARDQNKNPREARLEKIDSECLYSLSIQKTKLKCSCQIKKQQQEPKYRKRA